MSFPLIQSLSNSLCGLQTFQCLCNLPIRLLFWIQKKYASDSEKDIWFHRNVESSNKIQSNSFGVILHDDKLSQVYNCQYKGSRETGDLFYRRRWYCCDVYSYITIFLLCAFGIIGCVNSQRVSIPYKSLEVYRVESLDCDEKETPGVLKALQWWLVLD